MTKESDTKPFYQIIKHYIAQMPNESGIYKMISKEGQILYIGKAKILPNRVKNYLALDKLTPRIRSMVKQIDSIEFIKTKNETEALILEASLIRKIKPKYNILLKDDKSFPYITIDNELGFGKIAKYRGLKQDNITYFGPFAKSSNVDETISLLQKLFLIRTCSDNYFKSRKRPCILYQVKRCSAPCVGKITQVNYQESINQAMDFLSGKSNIVQKQLVKLMQKASDDMDYEGAMIYRDRIKSLNYIQSKQVFSNLKINNADVIASYEEMGECCVEVFFFRNAQSYGNKSFLINNENGDFSITSFISQFYQNHLIPEQIILKDSTDIKLIQDALNIMANKKIKVIQAKSIEDIKLVDLAYENAKESIKSKISTKFKHLQNLQYIKELFNLGTQPKRIEIYDNSHIMGNSAVGGMVVFTENGFDKSSYRQFNLKDHNGDDYLMMKTMLKRRFTRLINEYPDYVEGIWPDLLIIDGGPSQLSIVAKVLKELAIKIKFISIAKSENRNEGNETIYQLDSALIKLANDNVTMQFIQRMRDESHRYAITSHRNKRDKSLKTSILDMIPQIGKKRKLSLLKYFGSIEEIKQASVADLTRCDFISKETASIIYNFFRN